MTEYVGYPWGWFVVAFSKDIAIGEVQKMHYFGQELVAFRGDDGVVSILDAYCPHLGAHLGVGGTVEGCAIRCPFHAWRFDGNGQCVDVPYAAKIPPGARIKTWPVRERNGLVFVWYDRAGGAPNYEIPVLPQYEDEDWGPWEVEFLHIKTHPREVLENMADSAHFAYVHATKVLSFENEFMDHKCVQRLSALAKPRGGGEDRFDLEATYYGPGYHISVMDGVLQSRLLLAHTPVDENSIDLRFGAMLKTFGDPEQTRSFAQMYLNNLQTGFCEDIEIWENKLYRTRPALCDGDGPIGKLRRWYRQFYGEAPQTNLQSEDGGLAHEKI